MNVLYWRVRAKVVAILDLVISSLCIGYAISLASFTIYSSAHFENDKATRESRVTLVFLWIATVSACFIGVFELWASIQLLRSTELERSPHDAARMAEFWRIVTAVLLAVVPVVLCINLNGFIVLAIYVAIRIAFLIVVQQFIKELEGEVTWNREMGSSESETTGAEKKV